MQINAARRMITEESSLAGAASGALAGELGRGD
jgi:hypothetical protein